MTVYGKTMAEGEQLLRESDPAACILRISLPMGVSFNGHAGAIDWITSRFRKSRPATLYFDEIRTPTYTDCMNRLYEVLLANDLSGVFHAGGPRRLTLYQIAQIINRVGGYDPGALAWHPAAPGGTDPAAGRQRRDGQRQAGRAPWATTPSIPGRLDEQLVPTDPHWHYDRPADEGGSAERLYRALCINPGAAAASPSGPPGGGSIVSRRHCPPHATRKRVPDRYGVKEFLKRGKSPQIY